MQRVCFVVMECAPFTAGGIGTWLANTLKAYAHRPVQFEVLFCTSEPPSQWAFARAYPGVVLHTLDPGNPDPAFLAGRGLVLSDFASTAQRRSFLFMCALEHLERTTGPFDVIEFVDWCGAAFFSINAKRLGRSFQATVLSVRLHSTESILRAYEPRPWSTENLIIADLERQALQDADAKIAHLPSTADAFREHFAFSQSWRDDFHIELPPVIVGQKANSVCPVTMQSTLVFTSKFQSFKRPQIFARGASMFAMRQPAFQGAIRFLSFDVDGDLRSLCEAAFPPDIRPRVKIGGTADKEERETIIRDSVAIFPGAFEAFCFAAYEAGMTGAIVVLNGSNPGFGDGTPWRDGVNCLKFDGTSLDLDRTLARLFSDPAVSSALRPVEAPHTPEPYWERVRTRLAVETESLPAVTMLVPHRNEGSLLHGTVDAAIALPDEPDEIVVISSAVGEPSADLVLDALAVLAQEEPQRVRLIRQAAEAGPAVLIQRGLAASRGDILAIVPAGFDPLPGFFGSAARALATTPCADAVLPSIRIVKEENRFQPIENWVPNGAAIHQGLFANQMSRGCVVVRRAFLEEFLPDEVLPAEWIWDLLLRGAFAGRRYLVLDTPLVETVPRVQFDYYFHTKEHRRETLDTLRRRYYATGSGAKASLAFVGDGELLSARDAALSLQEQAWRERAIAAENRFTVLANATSVRLSLTIARAIVKALPWVKRPVRLFLRRLD